MLDFGKTTYFLDVPGAERNAYRLVRLVDGLGTVCLAKTPRLGVRNERIDPGRTKLIGLPALDLGDRRVLHLLWQGSCHRVVVQIQCHSSSFFLFLSTAATEFGLRGVSADVGADHTRCRAGPLKALADHTFDASSPGEIRNPSAIDLAPKYPLFF